MRFETARGPDYEFFRKPFERWVPKEDIEDILMHELPADQGLVEHLLRVPAGMYDPKATSALSAASAWAYSDADTMTRMMRLRGLPNNRSVSISLSNDALFVDT